LFGGRSPELGSLLTQKAAWSLLLTTAGAARHISASIHTGALVVGQAQVEVTTESVTRHKELVRSNETHQEIGRAE
jgi:hypothetical protein